MEQEPKKLNIRINFSSAQKNISKDEIAYHYHWGRIIGFSAAVIIAIGLLISSRVYYFDQENVTDQQAKIPLTDTKDLTTEVSITAPMRAEALTEDEIPLTTLMISGKTTEQIEEDTTLQKSHNENTVSVDQLENNVKNITPTTPPTAEELTIITSANIEITPLHVSNNENKHIMQTAPKEIIAEPSSSIENTDLTPLFTQSKTHILSDHVKRFIISQAVNKNEPTGTIDDIIFDNNNIATVYAFSEVSNLESTTLYYSWSLNGKNVAKVRVDVGSSRWRSHSSKFIQPNMHGEWEVELQNKKGEKLAIARFSY